jgi:hypothetical protein
MSDLRSALGEAAAAAFAAEGLSADFGRVTASDRPDLADFQCNGALAAAKAAKANPREIAGRVAERLKADPRLASVEIAGPGFVNLRVSDAALAERAQAVADDPARRRRERGGAAPRGGRLRRAQRRQAHARGPPACVDHRRVAEAAVPLPRRPGLGRRPLRRLGLPDGAADRGRGRRGPGPREPDAGRPRAAVSARRRPGQGRTRVPRPRPPGDGRAAGRSGGLPEFMAALRRGQPHRAPARVRRPGRELRPLEGRIRCRRP